MENQDMEKQNKQKKEEQKYRVWPVVRRLIGDIRKGDSRQPGRVVIYTICGGFYPFLAIFLPKLAIGILEQGGRM